MKNLFASLVFIFALCTCYQLPAQVSNFMQQLPSLTNIGYSSIGSGLHMNIKREAETRHAGQHNVIILAGKNSLAKQNTAKWLARGVSTSIYRIDLSLAVHTDFLITAKNLNLVFEATRNQQTVLFFDEGDALFGTRTGVADAHSRFDDEAVIYFMSLVEKYKGSIIISVNQTRNINPYIFEKYVRFNIR
jgi:hypothetical protein